MADTAIFDVDGTLVDSNYQHALAWFRAFRRYDITLPVWQLHRAVGMGGDQLVEHVTDRDVEKQFGDGLRDAWSQEFEPMLSEVQPFEGARELLKEVKRRGFRLVLASSGTQDVVDAFLDTFGGKDLADDWTTSDDAEKSKPAPDLLEVAMSKVEGSTAVMVGDSIWDVASAKKLDVPTLTVLTGGFSGGELRDAGAAGVFHSLDDLRRNLDDTPLARPS